MKWIFLVFLFSKYFCALKCQTKMKNRQEGVLSWLLAQQISSLDKRLNEQSKNINNLRQRLTNSEKKTNIDIEHAMQISKRNAKEFRRIRNYLKKMEGGTVYEHWGRTNCTSQNAETIYTGYMGGSYYKGGTGGAPNKLCLPSEPQWGVDDNRVNKSPHIGATLMDNYDINIKNTLFDQKYSFYRIECAVCLTTSKRSISLMIPGRKDCYNGWHKEYSGYLMAGYPSHSAASDYLCLDGNPDFLHRIPSVSYKSLIYSVYSKCNGATSCPPYVEGKEMVCVVCSK